jgi:hypothetical protein
MCCGRGITAARQDRGCSCANGNYVCCSSYTAAISGRTKRSPSSPFQVDMAQTQSGPELLPGRLHIIFLFSRLAAPTRGAARVALLACAVAHHREVLALGAHVARIALCDRADAAFGCQLLGVRLGGGCFCCGLVGEEGGDVRFGAGVVGDLFCEFDCALLVIALEGDDFGGGDRDGSDRFKLAGSAAGEGRDRSTGGGCLGGSSGCSALRLAGRAVDLAALNQGRFVATGPAVDMGEVVPAEIGDRELAEDVVEDRGRVLDRLVPCTKPEGSKRVKVKASTYSSSGTPYCRPSDTAMAKLFIIARKAAPSLCMSMKISPRRPSAYSPVWT